MIISRLESGHSRWNRPSLIRLDQFLPRCKHGTTMRLLSRLVHGEYVIEARSGMSDYWSDTRFYALSLSLSLHHPSITNRLKFWEGNRLKEQRISQRNQNVVVRTPFCIPPLTIHRFSHTIRTDTYGLSKATSGNQVSKSIPRSFSRYPRAE